MSWKVTALKEGQSFEWSALDPGVRSVAGHRAIREGTGSRVTLWVEQTGLIARLFAEKFEKLSRDYLQIEAEGLKRRCEGGVN